MKHKKRLMCFLVFLFLFPSFPMSISAQFPPNFRNISNQIGYNPRSITPEKVSFHPSLEQFSIQWWYFEGIYDQGYNSVVNIILVSRGPIGICITHLNIFHDNDPTISFTKRTITPIQQFHGSEHYPDIFIREKKIVDFDQDVYNSSETWNYHVSLEIDDHAVDLIFTGLSLGWQGEIIGGLYGPVLPKADVDGTLKIEGEVVNVSGLGYHEHAHGVAFPIRQWGWYWGKVVGKNSSVFWGKMMNTRWDELARAAVFSYKDSPFIDIKQENIEFELKDIIFNKRRFIPTTFIINISDEINNVFVNVTMTSIHIYHLPIGFFNYWRYVLKINGEITYQGKTEVLQNKPQIMELMRFY